MEAQDIKNKIKNEPNLIEDVLIAIGFHHVRNVRNKRISCAFPDGDNINSLQILLSENDDGNAYLYTSSYTRNFESGDFFAFIKWQQDFNKIGEAIAFVANEIGEEYNHIKDNRKPSDCARFLKSYIRKKNKPDSYIDKVIDEINLDAFYKIRSMDFYDDGINIDAQEKFNVMMDYWENRIVFPIRNEYGQLLSVKGRTLSLDYKEEGIAKYWYYYKHSANRYLYGLFENYHDIIEEDEIILVEAEKGVQQTYSFEIKNVVGISKSTISDIQIKKILQLGIRRVVIMFDEGIELEHILKQCAKFKGLIEVYYVFDSFGILKSKESPTDNGYDIYMKLYDNKILYKKGDINE